LTGRLAVEWKAMALQVLLGLAEHGHLMNAKEPTQKEVDRARHWAVQAAGDLRLWQRVGEILADRYVHGRSLLHPEQEERLRESIDTADWLVEAFNDHVEWLRFLQEDSTKGRANQPNHEPALDLTPIDIEGLHAAVEREAKVSAEQIFAMAKAEA